MKTKRTPTGSPSTTWKQAFVQALQSRGTPVRRNAMKIKAANTFSARSRSMGMAVTFTGLRNVARRAIINTNLREVGHEYVNNEDVEANLVNRDQGARDHSVFSSRDRTCGKKMQSIPPKKDAEKSCDLKLGK